MKNGKLIGLWVFCLEKGSFGELSKEILKKILVFKKEIRDFDVKISFLGSAYFEMSFLAPPSLKIYFLGSACFKNYFTAPPNGFFALKRGRRHFQRAFLKIF